MISKPIQCTITYNLTPIHIKKHQSKVSIPRMSLVKHAFSDNKISNIYDAHVNLQYANTTSLSSLLVYWRSIRKIRQRSQITCSCIWSERNIKSNARQKKNKKTSSWISLSNEFQRLTIKRKAKFKFKLCYTFTDKKT